MIAPGSGFEGQPTEEGRASAEESIGEAGGEEGFVSFITDSLLLDSFLGQGGATRRDSRRRCATRHGSRS